jgi:hypothetical protein
MSKVLKDLGMISDDYQTIDEAITVGLAIIVLLSQCDEKGLYNGAHYVLVTKSVNGITVWNANPGDKKPHKTYESWEIYNALVLDKYPSSPHSTYPDIIYEYPCVG